MKSQMLGNVKMSQLWFDPLLNLNIFSSVSGLTLKALELEKLCGTLLLLACRRLLFVAEIAILKSWAAIVV